jgi:FkbM family methyltransferase
MDTKEAIKQYENINPMVTMNVDGTQVHYAVPTVHTLWRVESLHQKEPDTIAWIGGFAASDVLVDIGANVGMYTIWAAKTRGVKVYAFEPESQNYALLNRNIFLNQLGGQAHAYCVALSDSTGYSDLHLSNFVVGGSCHTFDEKLNFQLKPFQPHFSQACFSTTLDSMIEQKVIPVPQHIKIDVDGIEHKVIEGCKKTLQRAELQSVLVELNTHLPEHNDIIAYMRGIGFGLSQEQLQIAIRTSGTFEGVGNHIFRRDLA